MSGIGSSHSPERAALHRLRSVLARLKAELELAEADGSPAPVQRLLEDLDEAFSELALAEEADAAVRVLVVDDDIRLAEVTARGLRRVGFDAHASPSLRALRTGEVLVVDLGVLSGLDSAELDRLRVVRPIIVTGAADRASRALGDRVDPSDYLLKPVDLVELHNALERRHAEG